MGVKIKFINIYLFGCELNRLAKRSSLNETNLATWSTGHSDNIFKGANETFGSSDG